MSCKTLTILDLQSQIIELFEVLSQFGIPMLKKCCFGSRVCTVKFLVLTTETGNFGNYFIVVTILDVLINLQNIQNVKWLSKTQNFRLQWKSFESFDKKAELGYVYFTSLWLLCKIPAKFFTIVQDLISTVSPWLLSLQSFHFRNQLCPPSLEVRWIWSELSMKPWQRA